MLELCAIHSVPEGETRGFDVPGHRLFVVRKDLQCHVYRNSCPHQGVQLHWMEDKFLDRSGQYIQCSTHGALFEIATGRCIEGPCLGRSLEAVDSEQRDGKLYVFL